MIKLNRPTPDWGHALLTPEGKEIRVPKFAFEPLRRLGALERNRAKLKPIIYQLLDREYDDLLMGLRQLLGVDLSGPDWLVCRCHECKEKEGLTDNTRKPRFAKPNTGACATDILVKEIKARRKYAA